MAVKVRDGFVNTDKHPGLDCSGDPGLTDQSQSADCDVNVIVSRFMKTGVLPNVDREALYGDFTSAPDYLTAMNMVIKAQEQFEGLSADVRKRFANDPAEFLAFVGDAKNQDEMIKLGLATRKEAPPVDVPVVDKKGAAGEAAPK